MLRADRHLCLQVGRQARSSLTSETFVYSSKWGNMVLTAWLSFQHTLESSLSQPGRPREAKVWPISQERRQELQEREHLAVSGLGNKGTNAQHQHSALISVSENIGIEARPAGQGRKSL